MPEELYLPGRWTSWLPNGLQQYMPFNLNNWPDEIVSISALLGAILAMLCAVVALLFAVAVLFVIMSVTLSIRFYKRIART